MADKQIIINGKECRYWFRLNPGDYRKCSLRGKNDNCDEINDCFVKELLGKLALKEQECEELEKLYKELQDDMLSCNKCRATIKLQQQLDQLKAENEKLEQVLTEIKDITESLAPMTDEYDNCYYKDRCSKCEVKEDCQYFKIEQILQKISECEENNDMENN